MPFDTELAQAFEQIVERLGRDVVYRAVTRAGYSTATGNRTVTTTDTPCRAVVGRARREPWGADNKVAEIVGYTIAASALPSVTPNEGDRVVDQGVVRTVVRVERTREQAWHLTTADPV